MTRNQTAVTFRDTEFTVGNDTYFVDGCITVEYDWVDHGIGAYEAWGQRGFDSKMGADEVTCVEVEALERLDLTNGNRTVPLTPAEEAEIAPLVVKAINDLLDDDPKFRNAVYEQVERD